MKSFILDCLGAIAIVAIASLTVPFFADYRARAESGGWLAQMQDTQQLIAARALKAGTLSGAGIGIDTPQLESSVPDLLRIEDSGMIIIKGGHAGQTLLLIPALSEGRISWTCIGGPDDAVPEHCRIAMPQS
ncbi:hypothetical protein GCM10027046_26790 [Uliginosibacterium flavum]|uniref:Uncharacterized protein n=1 Tax=Uliginosibacterium flavum TaxID=1396831 RepID=A0ABV2TKY2_9RHOO